MKQVYNLLQTIEDDKSQVAKLKRQLHNAESILEAHTAALTRLTTVPELSQSEVEKSPLSAVQGLIGKVRVTMNNVLDLGIEEGDTIEIVKSGDEDFEDGQRCVVSYADLYDNRSPFVLSSIKSGSETWYDFERNHSQPEDHELYLIKSQENK